MKSIAEAQAEVLDRAVPTPAERLPCEAAAGLTLAEDIVADLDSPPYDKSVVDGYAVCSADLATGHATLRLLEEITAGMVPTRPVHVGSATRIMTGAPIPDGADAIVMVERTEISGEHVLIRDAGIRPGANIMRRGVSMRQGDVILPRGTMLRAVELGLLAEVGRIAVDVRRRPRVGVLATGNELVAPDEQPAAGQIRNSNGPLLTAAAREAGADATFYGVARDTVESLRTHIAEGLAVNDILLLSGGVSAGVLDLVPSVLTELGVQSVFHGVNLKPGKPLWFGVRNNGERPQLVFGLPGNPVSGLVCFALFVRPAVRRLLGRSDVLPRTIRARLTQEHVVRGERVTYWPTRSFDDAGEAWFEPLPWRGSGDLRTLAAANALTIFDKEGVFAAGTMVTGIEL